MRDWLYAVMPSGDTEAVETTSTTLAFPFERIIPRRTHLNIRYTSTTTIKQLLRSYNPPNPQTTLGSHLPGPESGRYRQTRLSAREHRAWKQPKDSLSLPRHHLPPWTDTRTKSSTFNPKYFNTSDETTTPEQPLHLPRPRFHIQRLQPVRNPGKLHRH